MTDLEQGGAGVRSAQRRVQGDGEVAGGLRVPHQGRRLGPTAAALLHHSLPHHGRVASMHRRQCPQVLTAVTRGPCGSQKTLLVGPGSQNALRIRLVPRSPNIRDPWSSGSRTCFYCRILDPIFSFSCWILEIFDPVAVTLTRFT